MFGKLIKNEFKNTWKYILVMSLTVIALSIIGGLQMHMINHESGGLIYRFSQLYMGLYVIAMIVFQFIVAFFLMGRFYKKMFTTEGYLMHTLPVTVDEHIGSLLITGTIWSYFFVLVTLLSVYFCFVNGADRASFEQAIHEMMKYYHVTGDTVLMIVALILGPFVSLLSAYCAMALGQLFKTHRILGSVIMYIILMVAVSTISNYCMTGYFNQMTVKIDNYTYQDTVEGAVNLINDVFGTLGLFSLIAELVQGCVYWIITRLMITRKLDLQ